MAKRGWLGCSGGMGGRLALGVQGGTPCSRMAKMAKGDILLFLLLLSAPKSQRGFQPVGVAGLLSGFQGRTISSCWLQAALPSQCR
jgi:hypothetical protein